MKKIIIAIDGYSACGKSTTARSVAARLGYTYVDSGAMYRAVTYYLLQHNISLTDEAAVSKALEDVQITFEHDKEGNPVIYLNEEPVEEKIRTMQVSDNVSVVAANSEVRTAMVRIQQQLGAAKAIVMDGRDIGTVVFPQAELKVFMTAEPKIRAERRLKELAAKGVYPGLGEVMANIADRDHKDTTRLDSPLRMADDAVEVDNSFLTFNQQVNKIVELADKIIKE